MCPAPGESRSRHRWGFSRLRKDKGLSQPNLSASVQEDLGHQYVPSESGEKLEIALRAGVKMDHREDLGQSWKRPRVRKTTMIITVAAAIN